MAYNVFDTHELTEVINEIKIPQTAILDTFFHTTKNHTTKFLEVHIKKGKRRLAPFVSKRGAGVVIKKDGYEVLLLEAPRIRMKDPFDASELEDRPMGAPIHFKGGVKPGAILQMKIGETLADYKERITRTKEWMAAQALLNGKVPIKGRDVDAEVDFLFDPSWQFPVLTGSQKWDDPASNPAEDIRGWVTKISQESGLPANKMIVGTKVQNALTINPTVLKLLDNRRMEIGRVKPENVPLGLKYICTIEDIPIFGYNEWYVDPDTDIEMPMIPEDRVILGSTFARATIHYGMIKDHKAGNFATDFFAKSWEQEDPSVRWILCESDPLPSPHQVSAFMSPTVV
jgi:hypothetical protein